MVDWWQKEIGQITVSDRYAKETRKWFLTRRFSPIATTPFTLIWSFIKDWAVLMALTFNNVNYIILRVGGVRCGMV
jgi:hypothetical protein